MTYLDPDDFTEQTGSVYQEVAKAAEQYIELFKMRVSNFNADAAVIKVFLNCGMHQFILIIGCVQKAFELTSNPDVRKIVAGALRCIIVMQSP